MMRDTPSTLHRQPLVGEVVSMPWLETAPVEERERFIAEDQHGLYTRVGLTP